MKYTMSATKPNGSVSHYPCESREEAGQMIIQLLTFILALNPDLEPAETNIDPSSPDMRIDFKRKDGSPAGFIQAYPTGAN